VSVELPEFRHLGNQRHGDKRPDTRSGLEPPAMVLNRDPL
jgi:hypothetical protein